MVCNPQAVNPPPPIRLCVPRPLLLPPPLSPFPNYRSPLGTFTRRPCSFPTLKPPILPLSPVLPHARGPRRGFPTGITSRAKPSNSRVPASLPTFCVAPRGMLPARILGPGHVHAGIAPRCVAPAIERRFPRPRVVRAAVPGREKLR